MSFSEKKPRMERKPAEKAKTRLKQRQPRETRKRKPVRESQSETIKKRLKEKRAKKGETRTKSRVEDSKPRTEKSKAGKQPKESKKTRLGPKVSMAYPKVRGEQIKTKERLHDLVNGEYSGMKLKEDFSQRLKEAEAHLELMKEYEGKSNLKYGDISRLGKEIGVDPATVSNWTTKGMTPRLYSYMEWATPKSEASAKVREVLDGNNGIRFMKDLQGRLDNYYLGRHERNSHFYGREMKKAQKYFDFMEKYKNGGNHLDIAKEAGLSDSGARDYLNGGKPWLVRLGAQIPAEKPRDGYKWLPKVGGTNAMRDDWIRVPEKVTSHEQIKEVLKNLQPLENRNMREWAKKYGNMTREEGFMHLLGTYVSDSRVSSSSTSSDALALNLSKKYKWSKDFGEATCYHLGQIGISAHRVADKEPFTSDMKTPRGIRRIRGEAQFEWMSENSPILKWMRESCLGFEDTPKTYQKTDADWLLNAPKDLRAAFLQGLSDGDGGVSTRGYYYTISTHSNHELVRRLLDSFGVETYESRTYVRTSGFDEVKRAAEIPPFRYAKERQEALDKTVKMIDARRRFWRSHPPSEREVKFMSNLRGQGISYGEIGEKLYDKFGYTLDPRDIRKIINDSKNS
jgi:hypothetical protein